MSKADKVLMWFAWLLPKRLVMWCAVRLMAHATTGDYGHVMTTETTIIDALQRWETA